MTHRNHTGRLRHRAAPLLAAALAALVALVPVASAQSTAARERQIRAALVYKVALFVTWPESALPARATFSFCHASDEPTARALAGIEGRAIQGRSIRMRRLETLDARSLAGCNLLYLAGSASLAPDARSAALVASTLIVVDGPRSGDGDGMVQLVPRENHVSLLVDLGMAREARLRIDATLLQLVEVRR